MTEGHSPAGTAILDFRLPERETVHFCCFQRPKLCGTLSRQPEEMYAETLNAIMLSEKKKATNKSTRRL